MTDSLQRGARRAAPALLAVLAAVHAVPSPALAQAAPARGRMATEAAITADDLRRRVGILAADSMGGRETGTTGLRKARDYLAAEAVRMGLKPAGDDGTFFARVELERTGYAFSGSVTTPTGETRLTTSQIVPLNGEAGVPGGPRPAGEGPLVWGGWMVDGAVSPARDLTDAQLRGAALVLRFGAAPAGIAAPRTRFDMERLWAADSPLSAILVVVEGSMEDYWTVGSELAAKGAVALREGGEGPAAGNGPPVFLVRREVVERWLGGGMEQARQPRTGLGTFRYELQQTRTAVESWNVVAALPGTDPALAREYVALGAHYDHEGVGTPVDGDSVYNGADDDGSGTAALLEIAERFVRAPAAERPRRSVLFVWHTAEEKGLLGSRSFADHPTVPRESIVAQLNIDMIGRNSPDSLYVVGSKRLSTQLGTLVEEANTRQDRPFHLDYSLDAPGHPEQLYCRSDHYNYARYGIPVTFFTTGLHLQYHKPQDEAATLDYDKLARVTRLIGDATLAAGNLPQRPVVDKPVPPLGTPCS